MAMTRSEFDKNFMNPENKVVRRAFLMQALATGPDWRQWKQAGRTGTVPAMYNDLLFCSCYALFRVKPTRHRAIQMRDFLWARGASDSGYLMNPAFQGSDERKRTGQTLVALSSEHKKLEDAAQKGSKMNKDGSFTKIYIKDGATTDPYLYVWSELFQPGGSMRAFLGYADQSAAMAALGPNVSIIKSDTTKTDWLDSFVARFAGAGTLAERYGATFNTDALGLTGSDQNTRGAVSALRSRIRNAFS